VPDLRPQPRSGAPRTRAYTPAVTTLPGEPQSSFGDREPEISYPVLWSYKVMGTDEERLRAAVRTVVGSLNHELTRSNTSAGGKYLSLHLKLVVYDKLQRHAIFYALRGHPDVSAVL
jgi:putative lipoic acid-binding regulatory protein